MANFVPLILLLSPIYGVMRLNKLHLENYRGFKGEHNIEFPDSSIISIIGVNGAGKTSILDAISTQLERLVAEFHPLLGRSKNAFSKQDITINKEYSLIECTVERNQIELKVSSNQKRSFQRAINIVDGGGKLPSFISGKEQIIPILIYYQTNRSFLDGAKKDYSEIFSGDSKFIAYKDAFNPHINYKQIFTWYLQQINIQNNEKVKRGDLSYSLPTIISITEAINTFLNSLDDSSLKNASIDVSQYDNNQVLVIEKGGINLEFNQLSAGEKMIIGMVLDIAYRMSVANPKIKVPLLTDGIILIDELELHLHPKWQMSVLNALSRTFPNIQFIVTTHSPLVINQLKNNQLLLLNNFKIISGKEIHNTYGRDVNSIIEDFMGASVRPVEVNTIINEIEKFLDNSDTKNAREKLNELKSLIDPNDSDLLKLETLITLEEDEIN